jgi:organic hydroperoxide reductase OsmC/OhrA
MIELADGSGKFEEVCLNPSVYISESSDKQLAIDLHEKANRFCFIANSLNIKIRHNPEIYIGQI